MPHVMPYACMWSAREAEVDLELRQGNSLLGRREAKPVRSFACSLAIMLNNTVFRAHTAWHATIWSCTLAKLANRAGSLNALGERLTLSDTVAIEFSLAL